MSSTSRQLARPERIRFSLFDDPAGSTPVPLPSRRTWPAGIVLAVLFAIFGGIAVKVIVPLLGHDVDTVGDLVTVLFQGFWVLGWSVGVLILFLLAVLFLFYRESVRIKGNRLVHVPRLGSLRIFLEYDLAKIRNLRLENAGGAGAGPHPVRLRRRRRRVGRRHAARGGGAWCTRSRLPQWNDAISSSGFRVTRGSTASAAG
ncbi:MAG: hypothetical protein HYV20_11510 [Gemmatimonadetes bacterium]|nr:hypothetical protein [Gemmatimonadota bacterium]